MYKLTNEQENAYEYVCFCNLAYEFDFSDKKEAERKIRRKLKYHQLGEYDQERVDYVRELKNDLYLEILLQTRSKYFWKSKSYYADSEDFDFDRMLSDYTSKYDRITESDIGRILNFAIYLYHLR